MGGSGDIARLDEQAVDAVGDDLGHATAAGGDDGNFQGHGFDQDASEGFGLGGGVDQDVEGGDGGGDIRLERDEVDALGQAVVLDEFPEVGFERGVLIEGAADDGELAGTAGLRPLGGDAEDNVLTLPGGEATDDAEERFRVGETELGAEGASGIASVAGERDAVVDRADGVCGNALADQGLLAELRNCGQTGLQSTGTRDEGASDGPAEEVGGKDVIHPPGGRDGEGACGRAGGEMILVRAGEEDVGSEFGGELLESVCGLLEFLPGAEFGERVEAASDHAKFIEGGGESVVASGPLEGIDGAGERAVRGAGDGHVPGVADAGMGEEFEDIDLGASQDLGDVIDQQDSDAVTVGHGGDPAGEAGVWSRMSRKMACAREQCGRRRRWRLFFLIYPCRVRASGQCPSTLLKVTGA